MAHLPTRHTAQTPRLPANHWLLPTVRRIGHPPQKNFRSYRRLLWRSPVNRHRLAPLRARPSSPKRPPPQLLRQPPSKPQPHCPSPTQQPLPPAPAHDRCVGRAPSKTRAHLAPSDLALLQTRTRPRTPSLPRQPRCPARSSRPSHRHHPMPRPCRHQAPRSRISLHCPHLAGLSRDVCALHPPACNGQNIPAPRPPSLWNLSQPLPTARPKTHTCSQACAPPAGPLLSAAVPCWKPYRRPAR